MIAQRGAEAPERLHVIAPAIPGLFFSGLSLGSSITQLVTDQRAPLWMTAVPAVLGTLLAAEFARRYFTAHRDLASNTRSEAAHQLSPRERLNALSESDRWAIGLAVVVASALLGVVAR